MKRQHKVPKEIISIKKNYITAEATVHTPDGLSHSNPTDPTKLKLFKHKGKGENKERTVTPHHQVNIKWIELISISIKWWHQKK